MQKIEGKRSLLLTGALLCFLATAACANPAASTTLIPGMDANDIPAASKAEKLQTVDIGSGTTILGPAEATEEQMILMENIPMGLYSLILIPNNQNIYRYKICVQ